MNRFKRQVATFPRIDFEIFYIGDTQIFEFVVHTAQSERYVSQCKIIRKDDKFH